MGIDSYTKEELQEALERKKKQALKKPLPIVSDESLLPLIRLCKKYIDDLESQGWVDDDLDHYIFEAAMQAVFGPKVFDYINEKSR